jgi:glycosyltransferase involved in cell wall biosynthesis
MSRGSRGLRIILSHVYAWPEVRRGGERYVHELGRALLAAGHRVTIYTTAPIPRRGNVLGVGVRYLPQRQRLRRYGELSVEACFGAEVLARQALAPLDVWHAFGTADGAAAATLGRWRPGLRSVYTDLGLPERAWRESRPDADLHGRIVRDVDEYLCLSRYANEFLLSDYGRAGRVVGGGVDLQRFQPAGSRSDVPTLLYSGTVSEPRKNLPLLLEALALLRLRQPTVRLVVSGQGDPAPTMERAPQAAVEATDLVGPGEVEDLQALYGRAWATVLPSVHEAFGLVLVESLACGTPVVTLDEGGPAELAGPGAGFRARARTREALAEACEEALELAASPGTVEACRAAAAAHDWQTAVVPKIEAAYRGEPAAHK